MFTTFEIGSLAKPPWRTKPFTTTPISDSDIEEARKWGQRLNIENEELLQILTKAKNFTADEKKKIINYASLYAIKLEERAGLDWIFDGEQHRVEMYQYPIKFCNGFKLVGQVRSFDNKYYKKAAVIGQVNLKKPYHLEEFLDIKKLTSRRIKIPITGPYTICEWSYDEYYTKTHNLGRATSIKDIKTGRKKLLEDISFKITRKNIEALIQHGAEWIQIDEPALTTHPDEVEWAVKIIGNSLKSIKGIFSIHICFSSYEKLFPYIEKWEGKINQFALEFANRDTKEIGLRAEKRIGYEILKKFKQYNFSIGLGVVDVHTDFIESPELVRDRILWAVRILGDPKKIYVTPDCGLRTRSWEVAYKKLSHMVEGAYLASKYI